MEGSLMNTYFLGLTAIGFDSLWGCMLRNGTAKAIGVVKNLGVLPDGNILKTIYTTIPQLDRFLLSPVIFYDGLTRDRNPVYRSLLVSLFSTMQTTSFCMIANGIHQSSLWSISESIFWGVCNQAYGAAFIYPLYFLTHLKYAQSDSPVEKSLSSMPGEEAEALVYTSVITSLLPAWLLYPAFFSCSSNMRQILIASYRATPILIPILQRAIAKTIRQCRSKPMQSSQARSLFKVSLIISGACAALGHFYALVSCALSQVVTLRGVFWPWSTTVDTASQGIIGQGCHLFLQNDWLVISAAVVPYISGILMSSRHSSEECNEESWIGWSENKLCGLGGRLVTLAAMTATLSPGAMLAWSMATKI